MSITFLIDKKMSTKLLFLLPLVAMISCGPSQDKLLKQRIESLSEMAELGTVEYTVKKIVRSDDPRITLGDRIKIGDRKILFSCKAHIKAGIDLKELGPDKIVAKSIRDSVTVKLPKAKVLSFNMPSEEIVEEFVSVTWLRDRFTPQEKLVYLQQGESDIKNDIDNLGILADAETHASIFIKSLLANIGFKDINVVFE